MSSKEDVDTLNKRCCVDFLLRAAKLAQIISSGGNDESSDDDESPDADAMQCEVPVQQQKQQQQNNSELCGVGAVNFFPFSCWIE